MDTICLQCEIEKVTDVVTMEFKGIEKGKENFGLCRHCVEDYKKISGVWRTHPMYEHLKVRYVVD